MYIKEVELKNFKSFGKRVQLPLHNDFIAVTGPNGSGKSNIIDALLFALCLSSSRAMRAERLPDLIYRGENGSNPDFAQVTVRMDNSGRTLPIDQDTIEISRKIKVNNNKYASSYYFNGRPCSQGELQDHLSKAGINPEGYNVVMQGDVTRIIEMTPAERRRIIDEIAGVAEFDEKKRRALGELDVVRERIGRVDVIIEEVSAQLSRLAEERDRTLAYQAHRDERRRQEALLLLAKLRESEADLSALEAEAGELGAAHAQLQKGAQSRRDELASLDERFKGLNAEINHKGEDEQLRVKRRIEEIKGEMAREEGRAEMAALSISEIEAQQKAIYLQADRLGQEEAELAQRVRDASMRGASLQGELEERMDELSRVKGKIAQSDAEYSQLREELGRAKKLWEEAKSRLGDLVRERDRCLDAVRRGTAEREGLEAGMAEASKAMGSADREAESLRSELAGLNQKALAMERDRDDLDAARLRIRREIAESDREMQRLQGDYAKVEARLRAAEDKGYSRAVEAVRSAMRRQMLQGLHGTIAELGNVPSKFSAALEVAAGARLQSIVAETDEDAALAIDYLKRSQIGRATFLPLNKLQKGELPPRPDLPGVVDFALNLVGFDPRFFSAFWYVFRDTLIVETLAAARRLMGSYRMVTLEGDLVEKSGAMTGGHYRSKLKFALEEGKRLEELSEKLSVAESGRSSLLDKLDRVEEEIARINREVEELDKEIAKKTFRLEEIESARPRFERSIQENRDRLAQMEEESRSLRERLDLIEVEGLTLEGSIGDRKKEMERLEEGLFGSEIPALTVQAEAAEAEVRRLQERIREIDADITRSKLREESCAEKQKDLLSRREALDGQKAEAGERRRMAAEGIAALKLQLEEAEAREREIEGELFGLKGARGELLDQILAAQRQADQAEREMDRLKARLDAAEAAASEVRASVEGIRSEVEACGVDSSQSPPMSESVMEKIKGLERAMEELEPVNMLAIEEYDRVQRRYAVLQERRETLSREREEIIEKLDRYDQMKKEAFLSSFKEINQNFREIFKELSDGEGELILESPEDPLSGGMTIKARPAGKTLHRLEAMSGGEKSLTALSFIFAIQRHRPAPFYAMDEIDMFLDGANAERVARLIKRISKEAQFIVVSLRRPMIQHARYTIGVTMQENNISSVTGIVN